MDKEEIDKIFESKVLPIMDKTRQELNSKCAEEIMSKANGWSLLGAGSVGPDGGMNAMQSQIDTLRYTGKWSSMHTEEYIMMVRQALEKEQIHVNGEIERRMIDKMIKEQVPKSSLEYVIRKAGTSSLFSLPRAVSQSQMECHIEKEAERQYNPSVYEKGSGWVLGSVADYLTTGGLGGGWSSAGKFIGTDLALNAVMDKKEKNNEIPIIIPPEHQTEYEAEKEKEKEISEKGIGMDPTKLGQESTSVGQKEDTCRTPLPSGNEESETASQTIPNLTNGNGWGGLLSSFGLNGFSEIGHNLGYVIAMLPDLLVGLFTGKTKSLGLRNNLMPLASIVTGMFIRNPILKMLLIGMGGANLLNKAGHEALDMGSANQGPRAHYKTYEDEELNPRISQVQISGNLLIATIDRIPCTTTLSPSIIEAYNQGALPLNTLANAILRKNDQIREIVSENYEAGDRYTQTHTLTQR